METQLPTIHKMEEIIMAENKIKTIGVLTSGGDAPGMNAAIRAVVRRGLSIYCLNLHAKLYLLTK